MLCETEKGCPISDIAPIPKAEKFISRYIQAKISYQTTQLPQVQEAIFKELGLLDNTDLLMDLEAVWLEYLTKEQNKSQKQNNTHGIRRR